MSFVSVRTRANFSPARNVLSTTAPLPSALSFVRTKAPPLPGLTCWNSTIRQALPSSSICIPFLNWFVLTVSATAAYRLVDDDQVLAEARVVLDPVRGDDHVVLDAKVPAKAVPSTSRRAAASASIPVTPARRASKPACCAATTTAYASLREPSIGPVANVRV